MKFKAKWGKTYNLELIRSNYFYNNREYYGLVNKKDGELFCDLSVNRPDIETKRGEVFLDYDFLQLFKNPSIFAPSDARDWIEKNIKPKEIGMYCGFPYFIM